MINVDSTIHDPLLGARAAAKLLDVKLPTLYAYASRGLVTSVAAGRGKARLYPRSEIERLKARHDARAGHGPVAAGALRWGEPVLDTRITAIDSRGPVYRGHVAVELARAGVSFERAAELLWTGTLPDEAATFRADPRAVRALARSLRAPAAPFDALAVLVPLAAIVDPHRLAMTPPMVHARARTLLATFVSAIALGYGRAAPADGPIAARLAEAFGLRSTARARAAIDAALVLIADHELNVSTFAARITASSGGDLHACAAAALAALSGPRHGGESDRVEALLDEARTPAGARALVVARTQRGERISGFSHPLYPDGDPRTPPLVAAARALAPKRPALATLDALADAMARTRGEAPSVDFGLVSLARALGAPRGAGAAIFAIGRGAGWIAHALEQRDAGHLLRPRARYVGR